MPIPDAITIRVFRDTRRLLKKIAAEQEKQMMWVIHNLVKTEADKLNIK